MRSTVRRSGLQRWVFVCALGVLVGVCAYWLDPRLTRLPSGSYRAWTYYFAKEARMQRLTRRVGRGLRKLCGAKRTTILVPARRLAQIRLELGPRSPYRFVTYRQLLAEERILAKTGVEWIVYMPSDFLNADHARRFRFLADPRRARERGVEIVEAVRFGEDALVLRIGHVKPPGGATKQLR
ncbi:MAG TPA: hypothetical protein EYP14_10665 [Planctomycetaceae bacterium]|nr:hypothetical protein [Planctomycetaceae bacterium]